MRALATILLLLGIALQGGCTNECEEACMRLKECAPWLESMVGCCHSDDCNGTSKCVAECVLDLLDDSCDNILGIFGCVAQCESAH